VPAADARISKYWCVTVRMHASVDVIRCKALSYRSPVQPQPCVLATLRLVLPSVLKCRAVVLVAHCGLYGLLVTHMAHRYQRYRLFSRFDDGVKLDRDGWFSVTE